MAIVGPNYSTSLTLTDMNRQFGLSKLIGKQLIIFPDIPKFAGIKIKIINKWRYIIS